MSLTHETNTSPVGYAIGDMKMVPYDIAFTSHQLVEPETGWFLLNGAVVSQTTYPVLFAHYGSTFNTGGEGAGNFRLPEMTDGVVPVLKGLTSFTSFGDTGGEINHTLSSGELGPHSHPDTFTITAPAHGATASHPHAVTASTVGSAGGAHTDHTYTEDVMGAVRGSSGALLSDAAQSLVSTTSGQATDHTHTPTLTVNSTTNTTIKSSNGLLTGSISSAGGGGSHNNMQPYLVMGGWLVRHG